MTDTINHPPLTDAPHSNPFTLFAQWLAQAEELEPNDPNACSLATVSPDGKPANRMVLMKGFDENGFVFFTNANSRKGQHIIENPNVAMLFHWKSLRRQVRIEGVLTPVSDVESDDYFQTRSVISRLGAVASEQSSPLADKQILIDRVNALKETHTEDTIPRPLHWHGYRLKPDLMEFWLDGYHRLHDRWNYTPTETGTWNIQRLYP